MSIQLIHYVQLMKQSIISTVFLQIVPIAILLQMTSSKEGCKRYFTKRNIKIDNCDNKMSLEREIYSAQCIEFCEKDPKVWISAS